MSEDNKKALDKIKASQIDKLVALSGMAGGIAHEINNPLAIILGKAQTLKMKLAKGPVDNTVIVDALTKIEDTSKRIAKIIAALRMITRDPTNDPMALVPLHEIFDEVCAFWEARMKNNGVDFTIDTAPTTAILTCRHSQALIALINLITNSFNAVKNYEEKWVKVQFSENESSFFIRVTDSGKGIPKEVQSHMFQPFYTTKNSGEAAGLGLAVSYEIMSEHQGTVTYEEYEGHTSFVLTFPREIANTRPTAA